MSDKDLDNIFKKKLSERELEFNPAAWEKMEALLDRKKRLRILLWWLSLSILFTGVGLAGYFYMRPDIHSRENIYPQEQTLSEDSRLSTPESEVHVPDETNKTLQNTEAVTEADETPGITANEEKRPVEKTIAVHTGDEDRTGIVKKEDFPEDKENIYYEEEVLHLEEKPFHFSSYRLKPDPNLLNDFTIEPEALRKFQARHEIWLQAGPDFSLSYGDEQLKAGWLIGLNYRYRFSPSWHFNAGINYTARVSPGIQLSSDSVFYDFGKEVIRTEIEHSRLDYIEIPISIGYDINPKHHIGMGAYAASLVNIQRNIQRTHFRFKQQPEKSSAVENGLTKNFKILDYGFNTYYFFQYSPQLGIGCEMKYGFTDITENNTDVLSPFHRNINARLILRYRLH